MQISRSAYYNWRSCGPIVPNEEEALVKDKIRALFKRSRNTYGSRRIVKAMKEAGIEIGRFKSRKLMEQLGLEARYLRNIGQQPIAIIS